MIGEHFLKTVSYLPHVKETVMKGHFLSDIKVSLEDRFYCTCSLFAPFHMKSHYVPQVGFIYSYFAPIYLHASFMNNTQLKCQ